MHAAQGALSGDSRQKMEFIKRSTVGYLFAILLAQPMVASAWTKHIDCEGGTLNSKVLDGGGGINLFSSTFTLTTYSRDQVATGSQSCKMGITSGTDGWGNFGAISTFPSKIASGSEVWVRVSLFLPTGFNVSTNTGMLKFLRVHTASSSGGNEGYHDLLIAKPGATFWGADGKEYTASYISNYEGGGYPVGVGTRPANDAVLGKWESYEMYVNFDPVSKDAGGKGEVRIWKNNQLLLDRTNNGTLRSASSVSDSFYLFTYWNGNAPATQSLYVDDIILTSERPANRDAKGNPFIGGSTVVTEIRPNPPTNVAIQ